MERRRFSSITDQVADFLLQGMIHGDWKDTLPGRDQLAEELGCSHRTMEAAMRRLAKEGVLVSQGPGRRRKIQLSPDQLESRKLNVQILPYEDADHTNHYLLDLIHQLQESGFRASFAPRSLHSLKMNVRRVAGMFDSIKADAWIVVAGSRDVLQWFARQSTPCFALFGRARNIPIANIAPDKIGAISELLDRLLVLGHRRIVTVAAGERRKPSLGAPESFFVEKLNRNGIETGSYNLPDWEESPEGLQRLLESLFSHTPPTALLLDQPLHFHVARDHLARMGFWAPEHVSLACYDADPTFHWCRPPVTHITWDSRPIVRRIVNWTRNIARELDDRRKSLTKARLVLGGTIGPAR